MRRFYYMNFVLFSVSVFAQNINDDLVGHWTFDNQSDLIEATIGEQLQLVGTHTAMPGPDNNDGAINIGVGSYYKINHSINPNGGGSLVNNYSIVLDVKVSQIGKWYALYQTDSTNSSDGDWFISSSGKLGIRAVGYTDATLSSKQWYRIAISVSNGNRYDYYINGIKALTGIKGSVDGRFALQSKLLFFSDDDSEDNSIDVADIKIFSRDLTDGEIQQLGGYEVEEKPIVPYLQSPTSSSIYVSWESKGNNPIVEYGETESLGSTQQAETFVFNNSTTVWHTAKLNDLKISTVYNYRVKTDSVETEIFRFKTQPLEYGNAGHIRIVVLGDNRTSPDRFKEINDSLKSKIISLYGENIEEEINLIFNVGDIVTTGSNLSEYQNEYFEPIGSVSPYIPHMVSIGNHEDESPNYYNYMNYDDFAGSEGEKYYSFRIGRVKIISLNSNSQVRNDTQINWLDETLSDAQNDSTIEWVFVFTHHPGHSELWPDGNTDYVQDRIIPTLKKYSKVDMLSYGHSHNYERGTVEDGNFRLLLDGGGNSNLDRWGMYPNQQNYPEIQKTFAYNVYTIIDIDVPNKKYEAITYSLGNPDKYLGNVEVDRFIRNKKDETPPSKSEIISPTNEAQIDLPFAIQLSNYNGTYEIMSSQFQITNTQGNYASPIINISRVSEDIYGVTPAPELEPIDLNLGIDLTSFTITKNMLPEGSNQYWLRVRCRDENLQWSEWSDERTFSVDNTVDIDDNKDATIYKYNLAENFPNPFNPTTTIQFDLPELSFVKLNVYNSIGEKIVSLVNGEIIKSGSHKIVFDAAEFSSGVYYIKLQANNFVQVKKMNLVK